MGLVSHVLKIHDLNGGRQVSGTTQTRETKKVSKTNILRGHIIWRIEIMLKDFQRVMGHLMTKEPETLRNVEIERQ